MPYSFLWSPGGYTNDTIGHLCDGNYKVVVTDNNGCKDSASILIPAAVNELSNNGGFNIYPVPASNILNIDVRDNGFAFSSLVVFDITGRQILDEKLNSNSTHTALDVSKLENGIYFMKIISSDNPSIIRFEITR